LHDARPCFCRSSFCVSSIAEMIIRSGNLRIGWDVATIISSLSDQSGLRLARVWVVCFARSRYSGIPGHVDEIGKLVDSASTRYLLM
jgi:hypothetical protein